MVGTATTAMDIILDFSTPNLYIKGNITDTNTKDMANITYVTISSSFLSILLLGNIII